MNMDYVKVVAGFLVRGDHVLHCQRHPNPTVPSWSEAWCLPGGKVELNETWEDALRREWLEEVSTDVTVGELISTFAYRQMGYPRPVLVRTYLVEPLSEPKLTPAGGQSMTWIHFSHFNFHANPPPFKTLISTKPAVDAYLALTGRGDEQT